MLVDLLQEVHVVIDTYLDVFGGYDVDPETGLLLRLTLCTAPLLFAVLDAALGQAPDVAALATYNKEVDCVEDDLDTDGSTATNSTVR